MIDSLMGKLSKNTLKNASITEVIVHHREFWNIPSSQGASLTQGKFNYAI
jgi:hypothetical protein